MTFKVTVTNVENRAQWTQRFSSEDKFNGSGLIVDQKNQILAGENDLVYSPIDALIYPIRTDTITTLSKDLIFPTTFNLNATIPISNVVMKIIFYVGAFFADVFTFPIRLVTLLPRVIVNSTRDEHPLAKALKNYQVPDAILMGPILKVDVALDKNQSNDFTKTVPIIPHPCDNFRVASFFATPFSTPS